MTTGAQDVSCRVSSSRFFFFLLNFTLLIITYRYTKNIIDNKWTATTPNTSDSEWRGLKTHHISSSWYFFFYVLCIHFTNVHLKLDHNTRRCSNNGHSQPPRALKSGLVRSGFFCLFWQDWDRTSSRSFQNPKKTGPELELEKTDENRFKLVWTGSGINVLKRGLNVDERRIRLSIEPR